MIQRYFSLLTCVGLFCLLIFSTAQVKAGAPSSWPEEVRKQLQESLGILQGEHVYAQHQRAEVEQLGVEFDKALDELASLTTSAMIEQVKASEGSDIQSKLLLIAYDRKTLSQRYEEIERTYIKGVSSPRRVSPSSPPLKVRHTTEHYRLVWEYYLLRPPAQSYSFKHDRRIIEALTTIASDASVLTVIQAYRATVGKSVRLTRFVANRQRLLLQAFSRTPTQRSLEGQLKCLELSRGQLKRTKTPLVGAGTFFDPERDVLRSLTEQKESIRSKWLDVIKVFPKDRLSEKDISLLKEVTRKLERK